MHPDIVVICVDLAPPELFVRHIDARGIRNIRFERLDVGHLTLGHLDKWARKHVGGSIRDYAVIQASPQCKSISDCSGGMKVWDKERKVYTPHRGRDGRPLSSLAIADDHRLQVLFDVLFEFLKICPRALVHVENPVSKAWPTLPPVKQALQLGWQMVRGDHCRMANELDDGRWWSQKPSWYVVANIMHACM